MKLISINIGVPREIVHQGQTVRTRIFKKFVIGAAVARRPCAMLVVVIRESCIDTEVPLRVMSPAIQKPETINFPASPWCV